MKSPHFKRRIIVAIVLFTLSAGSVYVAKFIVVGKSNTVVGGNLILNGDQSSPTMELINSHTNDVELIRKELKELKVSVKYDKAIDDAEQLFLAAKNYIKNKKFNEAIDLLLKTKESYRNIVTNCKTEKMFADSVESMKISINDMKLVVSRYKNKNKTSKELFESGELYEKKAIDFQNNGNFEEAMNSYMKAVNFFSSCQTNAMHTK